VQNILIGADLTANSDNAFDRAIQLAALTGARLHILHIDRRLQVPGAEEESATHHSALEERVGEFVRSRAESGAFDYDIHLETRGRTYELINQLGRKTAADLVVIGRSKRLSEVPGSVLLTTGQVVAGSDRPVLVVTQPVSGNYSRIALEATMSYAAERKVLSAVCAFGPDVQLTAFHRGFDKASAGGLLEKIRRTMQVRRQSRFIARVATLLQKQGIVDERLSISETESDPFDTLQSALHESRFDVVALTAKRRMLQASALREELIRALQAARCDALLLAA